MCRHLASRGEPRSLHDLVLAPPHSPGAQSWAPQRQRHGTVDVDGFGVGWWVPDRPEPVRYRRAQPIWTDASFASLAPTVSATSVVAAVRSATPGTAPDEGAAAPFTNGPWLVSHHGRLGDWAAARACLGAGTADVPDTRAGVDSALLVGLAPARWLGGTPLAEGLATATHDLLGHGGGRLTTLAATVRASPGSSAASRCAPCAPAQVSWSPPSRMTTTTAGPTSPTTTSCSWTTTACTCTPLT